MLTFPSAPHPHHHARQPDATGLISESPESQPSSSDAKTQLWLFSNPPNPYPTLPVHDVIHIFWYPILDFYFDISEWHILPARAWTPAIMLHLTNPCAKRKVLSLTKPKARYITRIPSAIILHMDYFAKPWLKWSLSLNKTINPRHNITSVDKKECIVIVKSCW